MNTVIIKCKMCGGDLGEAVNGIATCKYCGTTQTLPKFTGERKASLYDRANEYRADGEFDRAFALYEQILPEDDSDAEVYWDMVLCRYGIEYVEDPTSHKRIPTVNRVQYQSIFEDRNYLSAIEHATAEQKEVLQSEASRINQIQNDILEISNKEKPYDIFICYKETDDRGNRTLDSVLAQDLYNELVKEGYKVFFSRITLEDKIGTAYEPYIFAALNSAKIMIAVGTSAKNYNAVWVKNEWSRYLSLICNGEKKTLIPAYRDMDPYELPEEFAHLQAQDMGKLGFMQDLVRGIKKILGSKGSDKTAQPEGINIAAYKNRIQDFLENKDYKQAKKYCEKALDNEPLDAEIYCMSLCAENNVSHLQELSDVSKPFSDSPSYHGVMKYGSEELKKELNRLLKRIEVRKNERIKMIRKRGLALLIIIVVVIAGFTGISYGQQYRQNWWLNQIVNNRIIVNEGIPGSEDYYVLEVELSSFNYFDDYFELVPIKDDKGDEEYLVKSKLYDKGWYLWDVLGARDGTIRINASSRAMPFPLTTAFYSEHIRIPSGGLSRIILVSKTIIRNKTFEVFEDHAHYHIELKDGEVNDFDYYGSEIVKNNSETYSQPNLNYKAYKDYPF